MKKLNMKKINENQNERINYMNLTHEFKTMCTCDRAYKINEGIYCDPKLEEEADAMVGKWLFEKRATFNCEERFEKLEIDERRSIEIVYETIVGTCTRYINAYWYVICND